MVNDHYAMSTIDFLLSANAKIAFQVIARSICGSHYLALPIRLEYPSVINIIMRITYMSMQNRVAATMKIL